MGLVKKDWDTYEKLARKMAEEGFILAITVCTEKELKMMKNIKKGGKENV